MSCDHERNLRDWSHCRHCGDLLPSDFKSPSLPSEIAAISSVEQDALRAYNETLPMPASPAATPRTEAMIDSCGDYEKAYHFNGRFAEFARGLERESAALRTEVEALKWRLEEAQEEAKRQHDKNADIYGRLCKAESALSAAKEREREGVIGVTGTFVSHGSAYHTTPQAIVYFRLDDWEARDQFIRNLKGEA